MADTVALVTGGASGAQGRHPSRLGDPAEYAALVRHISHRDGTLIATVVQEGLVHANRTPAAGPAPG